MYPGKTIGLVETQVSAQKAQVSKIINFDEVQKARAKSTLFQKIETLAFDDIDALIQLDDYCRNRRNMVDDRVKQILIDLKILAPDGTLPDLTNEVMYEMRTGQEPFWIKHQQASRP